MNPEVLTSASMLKARTRPTARAVDFLLNGAGQVGGTCFMSGASSGSAGGDVVARDCLSPAHHSGRSRDVATPDNYRISLADDQRKYHLAQRSSQSRFQGVGRG